MSLTPGTRLGHYDLSALIGEGGMGQVWQATDTHLDRQVALKFLPDAFAQDPDRVARFRREAQVLASLNHPNIAAIYGIEQGDDTRASVLELVSGPTLADRIAQGPIPVAEALPIAEALEAAHEAGVIHRDLKPANIKVRDDGTVKVLDFGLAKALDPSPATSPDQSPTLTAAATQMGMILGTAAYMSPEQARGKPVDRRADIWAFGAVFYEMLTGRRAFIGDDVTDTIAAVVRAEPDWDALPRDLSPTLRVYTRQCLQKDARQRVGDMRDVRLAMEGVFETPAGPGPGVMAAPPSSRSRWRLAIPLAVKVAVVGVIAGVAGRMSVPAAPRPVLRSTHLLPEARDFARVGVQILDIAPDGTRFAYAAVEDGGALYVREMDVLDDRVIVARAARLPFFSADGRSLGYIDAFDSQIKRVSLTGGPSRAITTASPMPNGVSWEADGTILYGLEDGIWQVPENGGEPEKLITTEEGEQAFHPQRLPGGDWVLFTLARSVGLTRWDEAEIVVQSPASGERRVIQSGGSDARYLSTGHLLYVRDNVLYAMPFDVGRVEATGEPIAVIVTPQSALNHDIAPNGARFVTILPPGLDGDDSRSRSQVIMVVNWFEELKRLVPTN